MQRSRDRKGETMDQDKTDFHSGHGGNEKS